MKMRMNITLWVMVFLIMSFLGIHTEVIAASDANPPQSKERVVPELFTVLAIIGIAGIGLFILGMIKSTLSNSKFSLADVLSEEAKITSLEADGSGGFKPRFDAAGNPVMITELRGSSSRVIAFVGMIVILLMFMGFGIFSLYAFAVQGEMPDSQNIVYFLLGGSMLFAPYGANQFSALFEKLAPKKS